MSDDQEPKQPIPLMIDVSSIGSSLIDLPERKTQSLKQEQEGFLDALIEIENNQATVGERACIPDKKVQDIKDYTELIARIISYIKPVGKLYEVLVESRIHYEDQRERVIRSIVDSVESNAKLEGSDELLAMYQKARTYRSLSATKAVKTKKKNKKAEEEAKKAETTE